MAERKYHLSVSLLVLTNCLGEDFKFEKVSIIIPWGSRIYADIFPATFRKALIGVCMCFILVDLENLDELERIAHVCIFHLDRHFRSISCWDWKAFAKNQRITVFIRPQGFSKIFGSRSHLCTQPGSVSSVVVVYIYHPHNSTYPSFSYTKLDLIYRHTGGEFAELHTQYIWQKRSRWNHTRIYKVQYSKTRIQFRLNSWIYCLFPCIDKKRSLQQWFSAQKALLRAV